MKKLTVTTPDVSIRVAPERGELVQTREIDGEKYSGRHLLNKVNRVMRAAFNADLPQDEREYAIDFFWYLWCGPDSPLFDKSKMATFERYFIEDKATHAETKGNYYTLRDRVDVCDKILDEFKVKGEHRHIMGPTPFPLSAWQCTKIGAGTVPFLTDEGWLMFYHGVITTCNGFRYAMGAAILDREDPSKVLYRTQPYLLGPAAPYELVGDVPNVVFPCASLLCGSRRSPRPAAPSRRGAPRRSPGALT